MTSLGVIHKLKLSFFEDFEIIYESWFLQYKLKYLEGNNVYKLIIDSEEYKVVIDERKEDEK